METTTESVEQRLSAAFLKSANYALSKARAGDDEAAYAVVWYVKAALRAYKLTPQPLHDFFLEVISDPARYSQIMQHAQRPRKAGRPSIDDKPRVAFPPGLLQKKFPRRLPSKDNALMIAYLLSQGYLMNESGKDRESAVELLSPLLRRSPRSLQNDFYKHKSTVMTPDSVKLGESLYKFKLFLHKTYQNSAG